MQSLKPKNEPWFKAVFFANGREMTAKSVDGPPDSVLARVTNLMVGLQSDMCRVLDIDNIEVFSVLRDDQKFISDLVI